MNGYEKGGNERLNRAYLLKVKCPVIARHLGAQTGKTILKDVRHQESSPSEYQGRKLA